MSGYELSRQWFDFLFENPDLTNVSQTALYMWLIELNNRKGFSEKFVFNSDEACSYTGIKDRKTVWSALNKLSEYGFVTIVKKATNQNQVTTISIINNKVKSKGCLDKAIRLSNNCTSEGLADKQQVNSNCTSEGLADTLAIGLSLKQLNNETTNNETVIPPDQIRHSHWPRDVNKVIDYFKSKNASETLATTFFNKYESQNWMVNGNAIIKWKFKADEWISNPNKFAENEIENTSTRRKSAEPVNPYDQFR